MRRIAERNFKQEGFRKIARRNYKDSRKELEGLQEGVINITRRN